MTGCAPISCIVLAAIRQALPRDTIVASDMTQIAYAANEIFPMDLPRRWLHPAASAPGTCTTGRHWRRARPDLPTAVLVGDYGFNTPSTSWAPPPSSASRWSSFCWQ